MTEVVDQIREYHVTFSKFSRGLQHSIEYLIDPSKTKVWLFYFSANVYEALFSGCRATKHLYSCLIFQGSLVLSTDIIASSFDDFFPWLYGDKSLLLFDTICGLYDWKTHHPLKILYPILSNYLYNLNPLCTP